MSQAGHCPCSHRPLKPRAVNPADFRAGGEGKDTRPMLGIIRNLIKSKIGAAVAIAVLILIALAFASGDVASTGGFGGVAGGDRVATVGDQRIDTSTLSQSATSALERAKQDDPTLSMKAFLANDGLESVLDNLIDRLAVAVFGEQNGIVASDRLVDSEISQMTAFHGPDGNFSDDIFRQAMQQRGISEKLLRDDLKQGLIARQVMLPASTGAAMPVELVKRYAALLQETREGEMAVLPSLVFADKEEPSEKQLSAFYTKHQVNFIRPERRIIRYATFGDDVLTDVPPPTDEEIAFRYRTNKAQYEASEKRRITQLVVPTEAAAKAIIDEVNSGTSIESAAKAKGLATTSTEFLSKDELTSRFSPPVADAIFASTQGGLAKPARSALGWHVVQVREVDITSARSLEDVRDELATEIAAEKKRVALTEALERVEDSLYDGANLVETSESLGLKVQKTDPLTADGNVYGKPGAKAPADLTRVLATAFSMDPEEPQLAEIQRGTRFIIYDVTEIEPSAPAPFDEIKDDVKAAYTLNKASDAAKEAATKVKAEVEKGKSMQAALNALGKRLPPPQTVSMSRPELARMQQQLQQQGQQVPPPLGLMFNMAEGTVKVLPVQGNQAWFVVSLKEIEPGKVDADDQLIASARRELNEIAASEYADALGRAIRSQVGFERNPAAIRAVREQLGGGSN